MILSNAALFEALADGRLVIEPEPEVVSDSGSPFGTSSVDLRLGAVLAKPKDAPHAIVDMGRAGRITDTLSAFMEEFEIGDGGYVLEPGPQNLIPGQTFEEVRLPLPLPLEPDPGSRARSRPALAARIEGKSSRARFGLLVHSPRRPSMPGWAGRITLEMMCLGRYPLRIYPRMPVCQLIVEEVLGQLIADASEFQGQQRPTGLP